MSAACGPGRLSPRQDGQALQHQIGNARAACAGATSIARRSHRRSPALPASLLVRSHRLDSALDQRRERVLAPCLIAPSVLSANSPSLVPPCCCSLRDVARIPQQAPDHQIRAGHDDAAEMPPVGSDAVDRHRGTDTDDAQQPRARAHARRSSQASDRRRASPVADRRCERRPPLALAVTNSASICHACEHRRAHQSAMRGPPTLLTSTRIAGRRDRMQHGLDERLHAPVRHAARPTAAAATPRSKPRPLDARVADVDEEGHAMTLARSAQTDFARDEAPQLAVHVDEQRAVEVDAARAAEGRLACR